MNHCKPNKRLLPDYLPTYNGFVITSALQGEYVHYVFRDKDSPLFRMPEDLFHGHIYGMKNTERIRAEKLLEFGDHIYFKADDQNVVLDYEKSLKVYETECREGKNLVKTLVVLPPKNNQNPFRLWSSMFGDIILRKQDNGQVEEQTELEIWAQLHEQAHFDTPLFAWISVRINKDDPWDLWVEAYYDELIEVAVDERKIVWETDWNENNTNRPLLGPCYRWESDEEEEEEYNAEHIVEKSEGQILDVKLKLEGYLIGQKELFCPELKDFCCKIGLWPKNLTKHDNLPLGYQFRFDAYYSDLLQIYIAYYQEDLDELCYVDMDLESDNPDRGKRIQIPLMLSDTFGSLYNSPEFGLIADPKNILGPLQYIYSALFEEWEIDEFWIYVEDKGPGKKLCRFLISECQEDDSMETVEILERAKELAIQRDNSIDGEGFLLSPNHFYAPRYPNQEFFFDEQLSYTPLIYGLKLLPNKTPIPYTKILPRQANKNAGIQTMDKYQFKIDAQVINNPNNVFVYGRLYNPVYGIISDPGGIFVKKPRVKKYFIIVEYDDSPNPLTLLKLIRMSDKKERMESEEINKSEENADINDEDELGLEEPEELDEAEKVILCQADLLTEAAVRERQIDARKRRRERDKWAKQLAQLDGNGSEVSNDQQPCTSGVTV